MSQGVAGSDLREVFPEDPIRVLVTGWRGWPSSHRSIIWNKLDSLWDKFGIPREKHKLIIVHGKCPYGGVDQWAQHWAINRRQRWEPHEAERIGGRLLGPERNAHMVNLGARICLAFPGPGSRGTIDCARKARAAGIEVEELPWSA
jgi:hypothetical protein